ncbi:MAG: Pirin domain protein [Gammaproteobacteria bacterium]|jgi:redox-sensitive bicupin YhaK (pirin superfamily)|nr:Pirin domain protein [Gammaproteobacteria bacterium]
MNKSLRRSKERGLTKTHWLHSAHSFSFADYYDPDYMGFSVLRVINQDIIDPNQGFGMHSHHNMEILTYVLSGTLQHKDSLGNESLIKPNELQRMSAGSGIRHSEWNPSFTEDCELLQIWILPESEGGTPGYQQAYFSSPKVGAWQLLASPNAEQHSLSIKQSMKLYRANLEEGAELCYVPTDNRALWLQVVKGRLQANEHELSEGDGLGINIALKLKGISASEVLLFDLPAQPA